MDTLTNICSSSIETLINHGFEPARTIILSFGFDEETSGMKGAHALSENFLLEYGEDGFAMLIDEGGMSPRFAQVEARLKAFLLGGMSDDNGATFALPAIAEKGYFDVRIEVFTKGGHSSIPPSHTVGTSRTHNHQPDRTCSRASVSSLPSSSTLKPTLYLRTSIGKRRSTKRSNVLASMHQTSRPYCAARSSAR
jgi:acetylornithine deacetylase/succinyl-diaminopimelate desuccinylase-like protein